MHHRSLQNEVSTHLILREKLREEFPDADDESLQDTVEGMTNLHEMLCETVRSELEDQGHAAALKTRISDMQARLARVQERAAKKRAIVVSVMERAEIRKITEPDFTLSLRAAPAPLLVTDEKAIPEEFWRTQPAKLDRQGLRAALSAGEKIAGATLGNGGISLAVRTR